MCSNMNNVMDVHWPNNQQGIKSYLRCREGVSRSNIDLIFLLSLHKTSGMPWHDMGRRMTTKRPPGPQGICTKVSNASFAFLCWKHGMFKSGLLAVAWDNFLLEGGGGEGGREGGKGGGGRGAVMEINASSLLSMAAHKVAPPLRGRECV